MRRTLQHKVPERDQKLILREANSGCTCIKSPVRASVCPPLCFIYIKNFCFQMYISPWLNNVAQGWTGSPCSSIICSMDLTLFGWAVINMNIVLSSVVKRCIWASREVIICYLPVCTASYGTSRVDVGVLAGVTSSKIGRRFKEALFFFL